MSVSHLQNLWTHVKNGGWKGGAWWLSKIYYRKIAPPIEGRNIFSEDWDVLIILDGCRTEWMESVQDAYEFISEVKRHTSVGSHSIEWTENTFTEQYAEEIADTAYISANPYTETVLDQEDFHLLISLFDTHFVDKIETVPAHTVTDHAIRTHRSESPGRLIIHYMQPHVPFLQNVGSRTDVEKIEYTSATWDGQVSFDGDRWRDVMRGGLSAQGLHDLYIDNLRYVLDEVDLLLKNIDANQVRITADHSNAIGEKFMYDHPVGARMPLLRTVPWVETSAVDQTTHTPGTLESSQQTSTTREQRLAALGYK